MTFTNLNPVYYCPGCGGECYKPMLDFQNNMRCPMHLGAGALKKYSSPEQMPVPFDIREAYAERVIEGMDMGDLIAWAQDMFMEQLERIPPEELREAIANYYPDLLEP